MKLLLYAAITNDVETIRHIANGNLMYNGKKFPVYSDTGYKTRTFQKYMLDKMADQTSAFGKKSWPINELDIMKFAKPDARAVLREVNTFLRLKYKDILSESSQKNIKEHKRRLNSNDESSSKKKIKR